MRAGSISGAALVVLLVGIAGPAFAQGGGGDTNEEVKKAVERAVGSSIATSVAESLSRSIVSEGLQLMPTTTIFGSPFYNRTDGDFSFGSFKSDTGGVVVGALHKLHDILLVHGALGGAFTSTEVSAGGLDTDIDSTLVDTRLGANLIFLNTQPVKGWLTLEGGFANFNSNVADDIWAWRAGPSVTLSARGGPILFEPSVGVAFSNTFEDDNADTITSFQGGFSLKYRGEKFRPQLNFVYQKVVDPDLDDDGFISVGPEILYAITPSLLVGGAYSYGTSLTSGIDIDSHTVTLQVRWSF
ncbi:MAG TPA: hypothetical protein VFV05_20770 [Methylomirabilota bacterium]|nr:hypothetical protein [Methylomirabilota bacterium]